MQAWQANDDRVLRERRMDLMASGGGQPQAASVVNVVQPKPAVHLSGSLVEAGRLAALRENVISNEMFYGEYHGHLIPHLAEVVKGLREESSSRSIMYLCGDSSLDNKYWLPECDRRDAINGYEKLLDPPRMVPDIAYWLNAECVRRGVGDRVCAVNASVEESTLADRAGDALLAQDAFIRDHIQPQDILVVSVGGNDVALRPTLSTIASIAALLYSPRWMIRQHWAPGFRHFVKMFCHQTLSLIEKVIAVRRPKCVVVCMYYYFDEKPGGSWADYTLGKLGYDTDPTKLQLVMREVFAAATQHVDLEGIKVVPVPLYEALDGKNPEDYEQRVEPSVQGGQKMATCILDHIMAALSMSASD